jgi:hypothetical protein
MRLNNYTPLGLQTASNLRELFCIAKTFVARRYLIFRPKASSLLGHSPGADSREFCHKLKLEAAMLRFLTLLAPLVIVAGSAAPEFLAAPPKDQPHAVVPTKSFEDTFKADTEEKDEVLAVKKCSKSDTT